ncbi:MAG: G1 family endopeptidase [Actinomycetota bacterium]|nr:G1 family endopeptidase [Actinomycetota bacterium]
MTSLIFLAFSMSYVATSPASASLLSPKSNSPLHYGNTPLTHGDYRPTFGLSSSTGYRLIAADGGVFDFGASSFLGKGGQGTVAASVNGDGSGYWTVTGSGIVTAQGSAKFYGDLTNTQLSKPIVGMAVTPDNAGYWLVAADGGVFSFGDAQFYGSTGGMSLNKPIVGMSSTPDGKGYWLVASDGGIFSFGDAQFFGSAGGINLNQPIVGMAKTSDGNGYWLVASDGGIFSYGDAQFYGSTGGMSLNKPIVGMSSTPDGKGYWLVASDGGIFSYGDAQFFGSTGSIQLAAPIVAIIDFAPPPPTVIPPTIVPPTVTPQPVTPTTVAPPTVTPTTGTTTSAGQSLIPVTSISKSQNWAGYVLANNAPYGFTAISGTFNIPSSIACTSSGSAMMAEWVGLGGWDTSSIIQAGVNCGPDGAGGISESAWYELFPDASVTVPLNVNFGDSVTVNITNTTGNLWTISFNDPTSGSTYTTSVTYSASGSNDSAEWIVEAPTLNYNLTTLAQYSPSVTFSNLSWTSTAPSTSNTTAYSINLTASHVNYANTTVDTTNKQVIVSYA